MLLSLNESDLLFSSCAPHFHTFYQPNQTCVYDATKTLSSLTQRTSFGSVKSLFILIIARPFFIDFCLRLQAGRERIVILTRFFFSDESVFHVPTLKHLYPNLLFAFFSSPPTFLFLSEATSLLAVEGVFFTHNQQTHKEHTAHYPYQSNSPVKNKEGIIHPNGVTVQRRKRPPYVPRAQGYSRRRP